MKEAVENSIGSANTPDGKTLHTEVVPAYARVDAVNIENMYDVSVNSPAASLGLVYCFIDSSHDSIFFMLQDFLLKVTKTGDMTYSCSKVKTFNTMALSKHPFDLRTSSNLNPVSNDNSIALFYSSETGGSKASHWWVYDSKRQAIAEVPVSNWDMTTTFASDNYIGYYQSGAVKYTNRASPSGTQTSISVSSSMEVVGTLGNIVWFARYDSSTKKLMVDEANLQTGSVALGIIQYSLSTLIPSNASNTIYKFMAYRNGIGYLWIMSDTSVPRVYKVCNGLIKINYQSRSVDISGISLVDMESRTYSGASNACEGNYVGTDFVLGRHYVLMPGANKLGYFTDFNKNIVYVPKIDPSCSFNLPLYSVGTAGGVWGQLTKNNQSRIQIPFLKVYSNLGEPMSMFNLNSVCYDPVTWKAYTVFSRPFKDSMSNIETTGDNRLISTDTILGQSSPNILAASSRFLSSSAYYYLLTSGCCIAILTDQCNGVETVLST